MKQDKHGKASVATYADYEVITPPNKLRMAISKVKPGETYEDPVARAEAALRSLASEFNSWMQEECERLDKARENVKDKGFTKTTRDALFFAAHDIKGEAKTFGFPGAAPPADSLCRLIEHTPDVSQIPYALIDQHVDTIRAIVRENDHTAVATIAEALTNKLRDVTNDFLTHANRDRPEYLKSILSPPTVPADEP